MLWRWCSLVLLLVVTISISGQQIYWKRDHIYVNGKEVAAVTPNPSDQTAPTAPTGLSASAVTTTSVCLNWSGSTDNVGVAGYKVYRQTGSYAALPVGTIATGTAENCGTGLRFKDEGLRPSTTYNYSIRAFDLAQNHSAASNTIVVTTPAQAAFSATGGAITISGGYTIHTFSRRLTARRFGPARHRSSKSRL